MIIVIHNYLKSNGQMDLAIKGCKLLLHERAMAAEGLEKQPFQFHSLSPSEMLEFIERESWSGERRGRGIASVQTGTQDSTIGSSGIGSRRERRDSKVLEGTGKAERQDSPSSPFLNRVRGEKRCSVIFADLVGKANKQNREQRIMDQFVATYSFPAPSTIIATYLSFQNLRKIGSQLVELSLGRFSPLSSFLSLAMF